MTKMDLIKKAIHEHKQLEFIYADKIRIVDPHLVGWLGNSEHVHAYQTKGETHTHLGWKNFKVSEIHHIKMCPTSFAEEPTYNPQNAHYKKIYTALKKH